MLERFKFGFEVGDAFISFMCNVCRMIAILYACVYVNSEMWKRTKWIDFEQRMPWTCILDYMILVLYIMDMTMPIGIGCHVSTHALGQCHVQTH